jgi:hypothetical protein
MPNDVDAWMAKYDNPQKAVVQAVRKAILAADKRIAETIKWQSPTFMYKGNLASFNPKAKQFASLMFHTGAKIEGKFPSLGGSGDVARYMQFASLDDVKKKATELKRIVKAWCDQKDASA